MAIIKEGNISGKMGRMVGYMRDGENVLRMAPQRTAPPTERELINQYIFRLVQQWVTLYLCRGKSLASITSMRLLFQRMGRSSRTAAIWERCFFSFKGAKMLMCQWNKF